MIRQKLSSARLGGKSGFTLIEILMASIAGALILAAIYTVFSRAVHLRDTATARTQDARLCARAVEIIRNDLVNGYVSGGTIAATLETTSTGASSRFPGDLRFTTTTADLSSQEIGSDVQEVEYYITEDPESQQRDAGMLVRAIRRNLLTETQQAPEEQVLLHGVASFETSFYDGQSWTDSWEISEDDNTTPKGVRVTIRRATDPDTRETAAPVEVVAPWSTEPLVKKPTDG